MIGFRPHMACHERMVTSAFFSSAAFVAVSLLAIRADGRIGMSATTLTANSFNAFIKSKDRVLVDFFDNDHRNDKELEAGLRTVRGSGITVPIGKVDASVEKALAERYIHSDQLPQLMWFLHGEPTQYHRTLRSSKAISDFIMALDRDPVIVVDTEEELSSFSRIVYAQTNYGSAFDKLLEVVAMRHMDMVAFLKKFTSGPENISWVETDKVGGQQRYTGKPDVDEFDKWVRQQLTKSEPVPEHQDGDSFVVVGQDFEDVVLSSTKDVFLMVYASWCGHCRKFLKEWERFARLMVGVEHLLVAKIDGDANRVDLPEFQWKAFPTVMFVKAGQRSPVVFKANRTIPELIKFANLHGSQRIPTDLDGLSDEDLSEL